MPLASGSHFVAASPEEYKNFSIFRILWYMLMRQSTDYKDFHVFYVKVVLWILESSSHLEIWTLFPRAPCIWLAASVHGGFWANFQLFLACKLTPDPEADTRLVDGESLGWSFWGPLHKRRADDGDVHRDMVPQISLQSCSGQDKHITVNVTSEPPPHHDHCFYQQILCFVDSAFLGVESQ